MIEASSPFVDVAAPSDEASTPRVSHADEAEEDTDVREELLEFSEEDMVDDGDELFVEEDPDEAALEAERFLSSYEQSKDDDDEAVPGQAVDLPTSFLSHADEIWGAPLNAEDEEPESPDDVTYEVDDDDEDWEGEVDGPFFEAQTAAATQARKYLDPRITITTSYRWICSLELYVGGQLARKATGTLIGPSSVLTVAHNLWFSDRTTGSWREFDRVVVVPGKNERSAPFGSVEAVGWRTSPHWSPGDTQNPRDLAVIRLRTPIGTQPFKAIGGKQLGWWGSPSTGHGTSLKPLSKSWLTKRKWRLIGSGYPTDRCGKTLVQTKQASDRCAKKTPDLLASTQWWAEGTLESVDKPLGFLLHTVPTGVSGYSGSPVWYYYFDKKQDLPRRWLVGVHVGSSDFTFPDGTSRRLGYAVWLSQPAVSEIATLDAQVPQPTPEVAIAEESNEESTRKRLGVSPKQASAYDWAFRRQAGTRFKTLVEWAAREVNINPGLLADTLIAETRRSTYFSKGEVSSFVIGTDDFFDKRHDMTRRVPAFTKIRWDKNRIVRNRNETGRIVKSVFFSSGRQALLASAVYLKHGEEVLREAARDAGGDFDSLPIETRFALVRLAFNAGHGRAKKNLTETLRGEKDVLIRRPRKKAGPQRRATIHAVRALRLSKTVFGVTVDQEVAWSDEMEDSDAEAESEFDDPEDEFRELSP